MATTSTTISGFMDSFWRQAGKLTCWAVSIGSIVNYILGTNYTESNVVNTCKSLYSINEDDFAINLTKMKKVMEAYLPSKTYSVYKKYELSSAGIKSNIDSGMPILLDGIRSVSETEQRGHAVVIFGYDYNTSTKAVTRIYYANPATGNSSYTTFNGTSTTFTTIDLADNATYTYTWNGVLQPKEK